MKALQCDAPIAWAGRQACLFRHVGTRCFKGVVMVLMFNAMPVIKRPVSYGPLFGGKAAILLGGVDTQSMRKWQERLRAAESEDTATPQDDDNAAADGKKAQR